MSRLKLVTPKNHDSSHKLNYMKHFFFILSFIVLGNSLLSQKITFTIPNLDFDSLYIEKIKITIDTVNQEVEVITNNFSIVRINHTFRRYRTTLDDLDTVVIISDEPSNRMGLRFILCDHLELQVDDPFQGDQIPSYTNKSNIVLQYWDKEKNYEKVLNIAETINKWIGKKESCNSKRNLKMSNSWQFTRSIDDEEQRSYNYGESITMASFNGSNNLDNINNNIQKHINECLKEVQGIYVLRVRYLIDETGTVEWLGFFTECPEALKENISKCMYEMKWVPGKRKGKNVKISGTTLVGINASNKYELYEENRRLFMQNRKPRTPNHEEIIADIGYKEFNAMENGEEVFMVVTVPPKQIEISYFEDLEKETSKAFPDEEFKESLQYTVEKDGSISNILLVRSMNNKIGKWLTERIKGDLTYIPGRKRGQKVRVKVFKIVKSN